MRIQTRLTRFAAMFVAVLVLAACGGEKEVSLDPPTIKYNEDISEMGMFVVDPRYTAAWLPEEGSDWILFDDIGELFKYRFERFPESNPRVIWVNDYNDQEWIEAEDAWYLMSTGINSPMGWGLAAFRDEASARAKLAEFPGVVMNWSDLPSHTWDAPPGPEGHDHDHDDAEHDDHDEDDEDDASPHAGH